MISQTISIARLVRTFALIAGFFLMSGISYAVPPAAPSQIKAYGSLVTINGVNNTFWHVNWQDNAVDEAGYLVRVRLLFQGRPASPYVDLTSEPANATSSIITLGEINPQLRLQFQVLAFKQNGNRMETRAGTNQATVRVPTTTNWAAPTGLIMENVDDGTIRARWTDNSDVEYLFELMVRKAGTAQWFLAADTFLGQTEVVMRLGLEPSTNYQWAIRAARLNSAGTALDQRLPLEPNLVIVPLATPALTPPTQLVATVVNGTRVRLTWRDNSVNAMGYAIQYRFVGDTTFQTLDFAGGNETSYEIEAGAGTNLEWRVAAAYQAVGGAIVTSEPSNVETTIIPPVPNPGPTGFNAVATALAGSVAVRWTNNNPAATQVLVVGRVAGSGANFSTVTTVATDRHHVLLTNLPIGVEREFGVVTVGPNGTSDLSNTVNATPTEGFDPVWYQANLDPVQFGVVALTPLLVAVEDDPETFFEDETQIVANEAVKGQAFSHALKVTNAGSREAWDVTGLPPGMSAFDVETDLVSGVPSEAGLFNAEVSLTYVGASPMSAKLVFRVRENLSAPVVSQVLVDRTMGMGSFGLNVADFFMDPDAPRAAKLVTTLGEISLALYSNVTPQHVQNFLAYVAAGDLDGVAFHRSIPGFVVQAGGFKPVDTPNRFSSVPKRPSPFNEPGLANVRGTIAAAKQGGDPDSATTDFFLNLNDNRVNLDNQNSGFTVFGRVAGAGMAVVDAIAAKPRGNYSVVIDGATATFNDWPMNTATASMDINQTLKIVSATEVSPLTYTVTGNTNPSVVEVAVNGGQLSFTGLSGGVSEITVTATDLDGQSVSQTFEVTIDGDIINPQILTSPSSLTLPASSTATFTVEAQGTGLSYQWKKNGVVMPDQAGSSLVLNDIGADDAGVYQVVVSNSVSSVTSASATLVIARAAGIASHPASVIVQSGAPLTLTTGVSGTPAPTVSWKKDGSLIANATEATLSIATAALTDAGIYRASVLNDGGTQESNPAAVVVVDAAPRTLAVKQGSNVVVTVSVARPAAIALGYQWRRNGVPLEANNKFSGVTSARLTVTGLGLLDAGVYSCDVIAPNPMGTVTSGNITVVVAVAPQLAEIAPLSAFVGRDFDFAIPSPELASQTPTRFTVSGLPPGVRLDAVTGRLQGRPTRAGLYNLRVRAFNAAGGGNTVATTLRVTPMPGPTVGAFTGLLARQTEINSSGGGVMTVAVTDNGLFSGQVLIPGARYPVRGTINRALNGVVTGAVAIPRSGADPLAFDFSINPNTGYLTGNLRLNTTTNAEIIGWKNVWHARFNSTKTAGFMARNATTGYYTLSMTPPAGGVEIPGGTGFASVTVATSGRVTVQGRTVDGQSVLFSGPLSPNGEFFVYQPLDGNTGSLLGPLRILSVDEDSNGSSEVRIQKLTGIGFDQFKNVRPAGERLYQAGFGLLPLTIRGGPYVAPAAPNFRILGLQELDPDAILRFFDGGLANAATQPNVVFDVRKNNTAILPVGTDANPASVTWKVNAKTGLFNGRFTLVDGEFRRTVSYFGQLVPVTPTSVRGVGSFQLPQLPGEGETLRTSPILTGRVDLQANPAVD